MLGASVTIDMCAHHEFPDVQCCHRVDTTEPDRAHAQTTHSLSESERNLEILLVTHSKM